MQDNSEYHTAAARKVIDERMDVTVEEQMNAGEGGRAVFDAALRLKKTMQPYPQNVRSAISSITRTSAHVNSAKLPPSDEPGSSLLTLDPSLPVEV
jgi:hypothetical protein